MAGKKGALDAAPEDDIEDVGEDTIFAGAEKDDEDEVESVDRGDDPNAEQLAAAEDDAEPVAKGKAKEAKETEESDTKDNEEVKEK